MGEFLIGVVGESFRNGDGSDRQAELRRCRAGEAALLEREPDNPHDGNCIRVISARGIQIGNVGREVAVRLAAEMDDGIAFAAAIESIGTGAAGLLGAVVRVRSIDNWDGIDADHDAARPPPPPRATDPAAAFARRRGGKAGTIGALRRLIGAIGGKGRRR
ncbi:MAG: HIRAN domain-containing protein [Sphingomonas sp.]